MTIIFLVFAYQDLWPLATYSRNPLDTLDFPLLAKIVVLSSNGVILPIITPYLTTFSEAREGRGSASLLVVLFARV